jgi:hypothetical protein
MRCRASVRPRCCWRRWITCVKICWPRPSRWRRVCRRVAMLVALSFVLAALAFLPLEKVIGGCVLAALGTFWLARQIQALAGRLHRRLPGGDAAAQRNRLLSRLAGQLAAMILHLVRHPKPAIAPGICYGQLDISAENVAAVAIGLRDELPPGLPVWSSPLQRCRDWRGCCIRCR